LSKQYLNVFLLKDAVEYDLCNQLACEGFVDYRDLYTFLEKRVTFQHTKVNE